MVQKNINIGSAEIAGDGESIRSAFSKIQDNFTELFDRPTTEAGNTLQIDLQGNVVGADSALIINSSDSSITAGGGITGDLTGNVTGTVSSISNHDLSSLGNVSTAVPTTGQVLKWNGSEWAPGTDNTGSGGSDGGSFSFIVAADDSVQRIINNQETLSVLGGTNLNTSANPEAAVTINLDTSISLDSVTTTSLFTSTIDTTDSSSLTITPSVVMSSDLTVENTLNLTNAVNLPAGSTLNGQSLSVTDGITEVVQDTSPQLGGNLDLNNFDITGTGNIPAANLSGALPAIDGSALTGVTVSSIAFSNITSTPTTLSGYGITDAYTQTQVDTAITNATSSIVIPSGSTQSIDVVAQDSTVLVDSVNGTLNATTLTGALPAIDGSSLTGVTTAFSNITSTPTTLSGYGITDAYTQTQVDTAITNATSSIVIPSGSSQSIDVVAADSTLLVDSVNGTLNSSALTKPIELDDTEEVRFGTDNDMQIYHSGVTGVVKNTTGTLVLQGPIVRIQDAGSSQSAFSAADGVATLYHTNTAVLNTTAGGIQIEKGVEEKFATLTGSTGVVAHDCDNGHVFYHTGASGDITANFTNLGLTAEYATNVTVIINQGATPYEVTAVQIGGAAQTINWQGGSQPTGNANGIDSFSFTILNDGGTYVVLGQMVDFT